MGTETLIGTFALLQERLHSVACRILKDEMDADDAVQDTFCNLWASRLPDTNDEARHRLFAVLKNVCLNKLKRRRAVSMETLPDSSIEEFKVDESEKIKSELLRSLPPLQRRIFRMSAFDDMEYEDIADALGMTVGAVRMNMSRARKKVREQYNKLMP
ncbi:MAG: sigma-70 family RNA polymerase sigma factor [Muribaculaceae bacterium]|nr:sigma-70 family RNA polymerase sigma factor [Muribaculaceae bacterium]